MCIRDSVPTEKIEVYREEYPDQINITPYYGTYYYRININKKPLDDKLIRQALSLTIDRDKITNKVAKGGQEPAFSFTPPDPNAYFPPTKLEYNPEKAKALLEIAGYSPENLPTIELLYNTSEGHQKIAEAMQQMWKENLGINIKLRQAENKVYLASQSALDYHISRSSWIGDYNDPNTFLDMFMSQNGNNRTGWKNNQYDQIIRKANTTIDPTQRYELFQKAENILINRELPIFPIFFYVGINIYHPDRIGGISPNILDIHPINAIYTK